MGKYTPEQIYENSIAKKHPKILKFWDYDKNIDLDPEYILPSNKTKVWWKCLKCKYEWQAQISSRVASKNECPCCETRIVNRKGINDIVSLMPEVLNQFNYEKNEGILPEDIFLSDTRKLWWKCDKCDYEWYVSANQRAKKMPDGTYQLRKCAMCLGSAKKSLGKHKDYKDIAARYSKRNTVPIDEVWGSIGIKLWWDCDICGEEFESTLPAMIRSRNTKYKGCSYCAGKLVKKEKSFAALHPELMDEYSEDNEIDPYTVKEKSSKTAKWRCQNNNEHTWESTFYLRSMGMGKCPHCSNRVPNYKNMLYETHPELEKYYDTEKNKRSFDTYSESSNQKVWWKCDKGHSFKRLIYDMVRAKEVTCPYCENKRLLKGFNDLAACYPKLALEFDVEKNNCTADEVIISSYENRYWKCKKGHSFQISVAERLRTKHHKCPVCTGKLVVAGINDILSEFPDIDKIWDYKKNKVRPEQVYRRTNRKFHFKCDKGHKYTVTIPTLQTNGAVCQVCENILFQKGVNSVADIKPELIPEWSPNNEEKVDEIIVSSAKKKLWICPTCSGEYLWRVRDREKGDDSCPFCDRRRVLASLNSLAKMKPELIPEWSPNNEDSPEEVFFDLTKRRLWVCPTCTGEYSYPINKREVGDDSCPYCSGKRVLSGFNSFDVKCKDLLLEWDFLANAMICSPNKILPNYSKFRLWWKCLVCGYKYKMTPKMRMYYQKRKMKSCPFCKGRRRNKLFFY